jgi:hypothetical protein
MRALVLAPYDGTLIVENANTLAKYILAALEAEGFIVDLLEGNEVKRANLPDQQYDCIAYCGHGNAKELTPNGQPIFDDSNASYFAGAVVIAIACESAKWLGLTAVSKGAKAYIGFTDLVYIPESTDAHNYMGDFVRAFMTIPLSLLDGYTVNQAVQNFKEQCDRYAQKYDEKEYDEVYGAMYAFMVHNGSVVSYEGKPSASLGDEILVVSCETA